MPSIFIDNLEVLLTRMISLSADSPVEQVHIGGGNPDEMFVTWVTNKTAASTVRDNCHDKDTTLNQPT
jgi:hypothetical protein